MSIRTPPHNLEAEQAVLGGLMLDPNTWDVVADVVNEEDFYKNAHKKIFNTIRELQRKNQPIDLITVSNFLSARNELGEIGGADVLYEIINQTPSAANIKGYAEIISEKATLRRLISVSTEISEQAYNGEYESIDGFIDTVESKVFALADRKKTQGLIASNDIVRESLEKIEELYNLKTPVIGVPSGFTDLDRMTTGFQPGDLVIIAARPSMGKTAFALNIAANAAVKAKKKVAFFSLEMGREQLMVRVLASEAQIGISDVRVGKIADAMWPKLIHSASTIAESGLYIDDSSAVSPFEIRSQCRRLKQTVGLDMIMIDYLQMMQMKQKIESREREVSEISRMLKGIAKELKVPVLALAQLNRGVEGRSDRRPMLSDLRESGSIEQDADLIMMIYRDDYYEKENSEDKGVAEILINKQRNGPTGKVKLQWISHFGLFKDALPESLAASAPPERPQQREGGYSGGKGKLPNFAPRSP